MKKILALALAAILALFAVAAIAAMQGLGNSLKSTFTNVSAGMTVS